MKYMITSKEKHVNHPINDVRTDLESFVLYTNNGLNDVNIQLVEVDDVLDISEILREVLNQEKEKISISFEQPPQQRKVSEEQKNEITSEGKVETKAEFQHLEDETDLWIMDFDCALGKGGVGIGIWIRSPTFQPDKIPSNVRVCSYKFSFECSNNEAEYEALIIG